ncbi:MAG: class I SAM-dependent methyltransferase [Proteobacteria bacterium]|nr:class I SAM-dependent methyltransferase [Pseudomonadota bacterium]
MIELASNSFPNETYPNLSFMLADARMLPFNNQFDIVFSNAALHWVRDHRPVLSGIKKCLKTDGRMFLQMGGKGNAASVFSVLDRILSEKKWQDYFSGFEFPYGFHDPELKTYPLDKDGNVHVGMVRLEVEAINKPA